MTSHTPQGWPYVVGSDALVDYPAVSRELADRLDLTGPMAALRAASAPVAGSGFVYPVFDTTIYQTHASMSGSVSGIVAPTAGLYLATFGAACTGATVGSVLIVGMRRNRAAAWAEVARTRLGVPTGGDAELTVTQTLLLAAGDIVGGTCYAASGATWSPNGFGATVLGLSRVSGLAAVLAEGDAMGP